MRQDLAISAPRGTTGLAPTFEIQINMELVSGQYTEIQMESE